MIRRMIASFGSLAVVVAAALGLSLITPLRVPPIEPVDLPRITEQLCPIAGQVSALGQGMLSYAALEGAAIEGPATGSFAIEGPTLLRGDAPLVAGVTGAQTPRTYAPCITPATEGVLLVADPASAELLLVNSDTGEASVDLTLLGPDGELTPVGARGIAISPGVSRRIALSVLAPNGPVAVLFTASSGRVAASIVNVEGRSAFVATPGTRATEHLIPAIPAGATEAKLLLTNPTENRLEVTVEALGQSGRYTPASATGVSLPAKTTLAVDLATSLSGEATSVRVQADDPIGAVVVTGQGTAAPAALAGQEADRFLGVNLPAGGGSLILSNPQPEDTTAQVSFDSQSATQVVVPAGTTVDFPLPSGDATVIGVTADHPLIGAVSQPGEGTGIVVQLRRTRLEEQPPGTVALDPALR